MSGLVSDMVSQKKRNIVFLQETRSGGDTEVDWGLWRRGLCRLSHGTILVCRFSHSDLSRTGH